MESESAPMPTDGSLRRLLLVHRDADLAARIREVLSRLRDPLYQVAHYSHLIDALTYLRVSPVDMVLVGADPADVDMNQACRKVGAAFPDVPLLSILEGLNPRDVAAAKDAGAREVLSCQDINLTLWSRTLDFCYRETQSSRELAEVMARLDWLVHTDSLTGLLNRKGMARILTDDLAQCRHEGRSLPVVLVDLDDFNRINANLGHGVGDLVLLSAARRIGECVVEPGKVGRCGTDRFMITLPGHTLAQAEVLAEKIRLAISRDVITAGQHTLTTTASLGLTMVGSDAISFDEVLARAQYVLQRSKLKGKNRVARAAQLDEGEMITTLDVGPETIRALLQGRGLEVSSQPIVNLVDGRIVSQEMLIRGPEGPLRGPDNLFRFCQEKDILTAVDLHCLKNCAEAARSGHQPSVRYHVNILPSTLLQTPVEELVRVLKVNEDYGHCVLEISEQQMLGNPEVLVPQVRGLQEAGIRIAIDDVGFGNSCLEGLLVLHPEVMKVDKRLVQGLSGSKAMQDTLSRLLKVAAVLEAEVVAEGIEEAGDYRLLLDMGVKLGQGYLFGKPQPVKMRRVQAPAAQQSRPDHPASQAEA